MGHGAGESADASGIEAGFGPCGKKLEQPARDTNISQDIDFKR